MTPFWFEGNQCNSIIQFCIQYNLMSCLSWWLNRLICYFRRNLSNKMFFINVFICENQNERYNITGLYNIQGYFVFTTRILQGCYILVVNLVRICSYTNTTNSRKVHYTATRTTSAMGLTLQSRKISFSMYSGLEGIAFLFDTNFHFVSLIWFFCDSTTRGIIVNIAFF
jgi:hypothetical protein